MHPGRFPRPATQERRGRDLGPAPLGTEIHHGDVETGEHTYFTLRLLPAAGTDGGRFAPSTVLVTPPNQRNHLELAWPYGGAVLDQSGATRPGTYVGPVNAG
ncbi:hypothetical protein NKH77_32635 [Streptomyces sp. M19]